MGDRDRERETNTEIYIDRRKRESSIGLEKKQMWMENIIFFIIIKKVKIKIGE